MDIEAPVATGGVEETVVDDNATVVDEVVDEGTDTVVDENGDDTVNIDEPTDENTITDEPLDSLFDNDEELEKQKYVIGNYNLDKYKDALDFENQSEGITAYVNKLSEKGFSQEQVEFMIENEVMSKEVKELTPQEQREKVKESLNKNLNLEEKRNYKEISRFLGTQLEGTSMAEYGTEIMSNPQLVKLLNILYQKSTKLTSTTNINSIHKPKESNIKSMSVDSAFSRIEEAMSNGENIDVVIKDIKTKVSDKKALQELLTIIGK